MPDSQSLCVLLLLLGHTPCRYFETKVLMLCLYPLLHPQSFLLLVVEGSIGMRHRNFYASRLEVEHIAFALIPCTELSQTYGHTSLKEVWEMESSLVLPKRKVQIQEASRNLCHKSRVQGFFASKQQALKIVALLMRPLCPNTVWSFPFFPRHHSPMTSWAMLYTSAARSVLLLIRVQTVNNLPFEWKHSSFDIRICQKYATWEISWGKDPWCRNPVPCDKQFICFRRLNFREVGFTSS